MAGSAYTPIATTTLASAAASYTFSSISSSYTDLVLVINGIVTVNNNTYRMQFNSDTAGNYSWTSVGATAGGAGSYRAANAAYVPFFIMNAGVATSIYGCSVNINSYSNTSINKTSIVQATCGNGEVSLVTGLWRSTAAINSITILTSAGNLSAGTTLSLYGITAA
jgi:hypothetical protein